ncbi:hypothetical protein DBR39_18355 [Chryseobacterium sp. KBW03]|nr:hypothetical protein DBR39_18355 [Chryseobacterium sp. KBW03]
MTIQIQLIDGSFTTLEISDIESVNDVDGSCVILTGRGRTLITKTSYNDMINVLRNYIDIN